MVVYLVYGGYSISSSVYITNQQELEARDVIVRLSWLSRCSETLLCI